MHRPFWLRVLIAVWGLWFTTSLVEPAGLFACTMHGTAAPAHELREATASAHSMASGHGTHAARLSEHHTQDDVVADASPASRDHQQHGCCTCLGSCCQAAPVATPSTAVTFAALVRRDNALATIAVATRAVSRRPYTQPFAIGPPALTL